MGKVDPKKLAEILGASSSEPVRVGPFGLVNRRPASTAESDPTEDIAQAARDAFELLQTNSPDSPCRIVSSSKTIRCDGKLLRVHVSFVDEPARSSEDEG